MKDFLLTIVFEGLEDKYSLSLNRGGISVVYVLYLKASTQ